MIANLQKNMTAPLNCLGERLATLRSSFLFGSIRKTNRFIASTRMNGIQKTQAAIRRRIDCSMCAQSLSNLRTHTL
ncbi:MAG: hypothetical protein ABFC56_02905, partial [Clostridiaceae bacterium]